MSGVVSFAMPSMVASAYVRDIAASRVFYELLGFTESSAGKAPTSAWSYLHQDGHFVLLAWTEPRLEIAPVPLLFYFYYTELQAVTCGLEAAGVGFTHVGYPPHALGGEVRLLDPDGNTILLGQREAAASQPTPAGESPHFSLLKEAAALVAAQGGAAVTCQITGPGDAACGARAEVRLADSAGNRAWACLAHADQLLFTVPGVFIASDDEGLARYLVAH